MARALLDARPMRLLALLAFVSLASPAYAQSAAGQPIHIGDAVVSGSLRTRMYSWNWFGGAADGDYVYPGSLLRINVAQSRPAIDWQIETAVPILLDLPQTAVAPAPRGQLGLGASYFAANGNATSAGVFIKQGVVRFKRLAGINGQSLKIGRMEFNDGAEVAPKNPTLADLKRDRISQRLLGNFGFSDVGRSIDGALYSVAGKTSNLTVLAGRPTQGVFQVDGWGELNVSLAYAAFTQQLSGQTNSGEWRAFALFYDDARDGVVKTDNRAAAARSADSGSIAVATYGAHYLGAVATPAGSVDVLAWAAVQNGSWGALDHRAGAFTLEAGWQPAGLDRVKPWFRGGYDYASGDHDAGDLRHGTFFQVLPTPRVYARFPFFNMMNSRDAFGACLLRPSSRLTIRADVHALELADSHDLWYAGGGAFQPATFGYTGRPSNNQTSLATLYDASGDYRLNSTLSVALYYGHATGKKVTESIYSGAGSAHFGYLELIVRF
jgi:alginate export protein